MSFGRHKIQKVKLIEDTLIDQLVIEIYKESGETETPEDPEEPETPEDPEDPNVLIEVNEILKNTNGKTPKATKIVITKEVPLEEIKPPVKKKLYENVGIIGNTIVCRDFRAIVKKKGLNIRDVITELLHKYNTENYEVL